MTIPSKQGHGKTICSFLKNGDDMLHVHVLHLQALLSMGSLYEIYLPFYILPFQVLQSVKVLDFRNSQLQSIFGCKEGNGIRENFKIWC